MYELKIKAAGLCGGIKLRCFLLSLAFFSVAFSAVVCLTAFVMSVFYPPENIFDGVFEIMGFSVSKGSAEVIRGIALTGFVFLSVCAAALLFTLRAEFCFVTDKNQNRPKSFMSVKSGVRYIKYKCLLGYKKAGLLLRFFSPFFIQLFLFVFMMKNYGLEKIQVIVCAAVLSAVFAFSCVCCFIRCRAFDSAVYLMYLNRMLSPYDALLSSEEKTDGKLLRLALYKLSVLPAKLMCIFLLPLPFCLPYTGVFNALICEKLYGENKTAVKQPAVVFYINKKTVMKEHQNIDVDK